MAGESTGAVGGSPAGLLVIELASVNSAGAGTVSSAGLVATAAGATVAGVEDSDPSASVDVAVAAVIARGGGGVCFSAASGRVLSSVAGVRV